MSQDRDPQPSPAAGGWGPAFRPWLEERILARSAGLLVVDKPSGIPTHGGEPGGDVVSRLGAWLESVGEPPYLGVHQRLDLGTSGVLAFVVDREKNAAVQAEFESGSIEKHYVAAVEIAPGSALAHRDAMELVHHLEPAGRLQRVVRRGGKACRASCRVLRRSGARALVELVPETGRTHQLRVQLAAEGAPIAGDAQYGGAWAPRLLLHAESLELARLGLRFQASLPPGFERWLRGGTPQLGSRSEVERKLRDAACLRFPLLASTNVLRWVNGMGDDLPGVEVDFYDGFVTLSVSSAEAAARASELSASLLELGASGVYFKQRARADLRQLDAAELAPSEPVAGAAAESPWVVTEGSLRIAVELGDGLSTGLFLDQRDNRQRLLGSCGGSRVLNLFSYTCSFSVAAALGGAARVTSVDLSRRALRRGEENFRLNGLEPEGHAFVQEDAVRYLERCRARGEYFDWIVLDPPSFSTSGKNKVLRVDKDYDRLAHLAVGVLARGGRLLAVTNHRGTSEASLRAAVLSAANAWGHTQLQAKNLNSAADFPPGADGPYPSKSVLLTLA